MDKLEVASNISDDSCNSSLTNNSGLTYFEDELNEIKYLINASNKNYILPTINGSKIYETRISNLNAELQNVLKLKEKYKNDLFALERQKGLEHHEKFEQLLKRNAQLETQLHKANMHIEAICRANDMCSGKKIVSQLENKIIALEQVNYQLETKQIALQNERQEYVHLCDSLKKDKSELESINEQSKIDLSIKQSCIDECKKKITDQHISILDIDQKHNAVNCNLKMVVNELDHFKKSTYWYKDQWNKLYDERNKLNESVLRYNANELVQKNEIDALKHSLEEWKSKYRDIEREMCNLRKKLNELKEKEVTILPSKPNNVQFYEVESNSIREYYENEIKILTNEIYVIRDCIVEEKTVFANINKENADLKSRNATLQKLLMIKEAALEISDKNHRNLGDKHENLINTLNIKNDEINLLKNDLAEVRLALNRTHREKIDITSNVTDLRCICKKFLENYEVIKNKLRDKEKFILDIQKDKQEMFMSNNWNVCELEEYKHKEKEYLDKIKKLFEENRQIRSEQDRFSQIKCLFNQENAMNKQIIEDFKAQLENLKKSKDCVKLEQDLQKYKTKISELCQKYVTSDMPLIKDDFLDIFCNYFEALVIKQQKQIKWKYFKQKLMTKLSDLESKISLLITKSNESEKLLFLLKTKPNDINHIEEVTRLEGLIKVKDLEMKEKQRRNDINNRTLLRKVKEHMKSRYKAEKMVKKLQDKNTEIQEELTNFTVQSSVTKNRINELKKIVLMKDETIADLDRNALENTQIIMNETLDGMEIKLKDNHECIKKLQNDVKFKDTLVEQLKRKLEELYKTKDNIRDEMQITKQNYDDLSKQYQKELHLSSNLNDLCNSEQSKNVEMKIAKDELVLMNSSLLHEKELLNLELSECKDKFSWLKNENTLLNSNLHAKNEEIAYLKEYEKEIINKYQINEEALRSKLQHMENESRDVKNTLQITLSEKFFFKRLSSDLKITLNSTIKQNEVLKERLTNEREYNSLPEFLSNLPSPAQFDDTYVKKILDLSHDDQRQKSFSNIHESLTSLKKEMALLQKQFSDKQNQVSSL